MLTHGHIDHRRNGETSFGCQSHGGSPAEEWVAFVSVRSEQPGQTLHNAGMVNTRRNLSDSSLQILIIFVNK
jgi:hypothetical protein